MSLYKDYIEEREGKKLLESPQGFASYSIKQDYIYIEDVYVIPEYRQSRVASAFLDRIIEIEKTDQINRLITSVDLNANGTRASMLAILKYGFRPYTNENQMVYFIKEI